jgi:hypothetical protein
MITLRQFSFLNFLRLGCRVQLNLELVDLQILLTLKCFFHLRAHIRLIGWLFENFNILLRRFSLYRYTKCFPSILVKRSLSFCYLSALALDCADLWRKLLLFHLFYWSKLLRLATIFKIDIYLTFNSNQIDLRFWASLPRL